MSSPRRRLKNWENLLIAAVASAGAVSFIIQWYRGRPFWVDEEMIALNLRDRTITELTGALWLNQSAPLAWLMAQRAVLVAFGTSERTLRALPVACALATILIASKAARRWMGTPAACAFVALLAFAPFVAHFPLEVKQYSSDVLLGLLLPLFALWAVQPSAAGTISMGRVCGWWIVAALAQWFSTGALMVAPACAVVLCAMAWRSGGWRRAIIAGLPGLVLVMSFAFHYQMSIRYAVENQHLRDYWWWAYPPQHAGIGERLRWLGQRLVDLAKNPIGTRWPATGLIVWIAIAGGTVVAYRRDIALAAMLLAVPLTAFVLSTAGFMPIGDRLSLWMMPAFYLAIALSVDELTSILISIRKRQIPVVSAIALCAAGLIVTADILHAGLVDLAGQPQSNHNLDDRAGLRYLMASREAGDAIVATHMSLPAVWWYTGIDLSAPEAGGRFTDGGPVLELQLRSGNDCTPPKLPRTLEGQKRVLVYLGFDARNPPGLQELVLDSLSRRGKIVGYRRVAEEGVGAIFDLTQPPAPWTVLVTKPGGRTPVQEVTRPDGCIGFFPAQRW